LKEKVKVARIDKEITLRMPIEEIFNYIYEPSNLPEFWPSLVEIKDIQLLPNGGYRVGWVYKMIGMHFEGKGEYTEIVLNQWFVVKTMGGINSTITWTFRSNEEATKVTFTVEYKVPIPLLGKMAEAIIVKMNDQEGDLIMVNLGARFMRFNY
jgi:uncharacterized membrane protein